MATLYEDRHVTCSDLGVTIHRYYFPSQDDKFVPYGAIRDAHVRAMGPFTGQWRIWGMGLAPYWYHLDEARPRKARCITLDVGAVIRPVITPEDVDAVLAIVRSQARLS